MTRECRLLAKGIGLAGALLAATAAYADATGKKVALLLGPTQDAFIGTWDKTFEARAGALGMAVSTFSSPFDPALQSRQLDDAVARHFDAIVLQAISQNALVPALRRAREAGIPVITVIAEMGPEAKDLYLTYVGENSYRLGALAGQAMAEALTAEGKGAARVAAVTGSLAEGIGPLRLAGFEEALKAGAPEAELVAVEDVQWDPVKAEQTAGQIIARFAAQGGIDGIYGMNDRLANAAIQAAATAGVETGGTGLVVIGGNCQAPGIPNLAGGAMAATVRMLPTVSADKAAEVLGQYFDGATLAPTYYEDHAIITRANLAENGKACAY